MDGAVWVFDKGGLGLPSSTKGAYINKSGGVLVNSKTTTAFTPANDTLYLVPFLITEDITISALQSRIIATMTAGTYRVCLYDSDANGLPNIPLESSGNLSAVTVQINTYNLPAQRTLRKGLYYVGFVVTGATTFASTVQGCNPPLTVFPDTAVGNSKVGWTVALASLSPLPSNPAVSMANTFGITAPMIGFVLP